MAGKPTDPKIIEALNDVLTAELTAINQYFLHAEMFNNWGYTKLYEIVRKDSIDEMKHAESLLERILYLNGIPNVQRLFPIRIGEHPKEIFESDLVLEQEACERLNRHIPFLREVGDVGSAMLLEKVLESEEEHLDWLEAQLEQIGQMGIENYLATQV